ncbi:MAG: hypothetical protein K8U03_09305 [Planctomycetia bacterium]|nr:hypothetical protein [Planctomycetia bacterium]
MCFATRMLRRAKPRKQFKFFFVFCDGSGFSDGMYYSVIAPTPGDARALLKKQLGGPLPKVVDKWREPV